MKTHGLALLGIAVGTIGGCAHERNPAAEKLAVESALAWLAVVDGEEYDESWDGAAEYFKAAITQDKWNESVQAVRKPLGRMVSRELKSQRYYTALPGVPDGEYVVIQYDTVFEKKKAAVETITPMLDEDGNWKVSGYFIK